MAEDALQILNGGSPPREDALGILNSTVPVKAHVRKPRGKVNMFQQMQETQAKMPEYQKAGLEVSKPVVDLLPAIGSMAPGPLSPIGAGMGAIARQALSTEPPQPISGALAGVEPGSLMSRAMDVSEQMALAYGGTKILPGIQGVGKWAEKTIVPGGRSAARFLMRATLGLTKEQTETALKVGFTKGMKPLQRLMSRVADIGERQMNLLAKANPNARFQVLDLTDYIEKTLIAPMARGFKYSAKVAKLRRFNEELLGDVLAKNPTGQMTAQDIHVAAQLARQEANPLLQKASKGAQVTLRDPDNERFMAATIDWVNDQLAGPKNLQGVRTGAGSNLGKAMGAAYARYNRIQSRLLSLGNKASPIIRKAEEGGIGKEILRSINPYTAGVVAGGVVGGGLGLVAPSSSWGQRAGQGLAGSVVGGIAGAKATNIAQMLANPELARMAALLQQTLGAAFTAPQGGPPVAP
jgi:hypothetical protein